MSLPQRRIGQFSVSAIGLGCMNLTHAYGAKPSEEGAVRLLNHALDLGCTLFDTAAIYGDGENEKRLGRALGKRRDEYVLASKCVLDVVDGQRVLDARPERIKATCEAALKRLGTDRIDLYYLHRPDPKVPIEDAVGALAELVSEGKIRAIGLSEMGAEQIERAHAVHPVAAVQTEYSLGTRNPEVAVLETCRKIGAAFVAFSPVGRGILTGAIKSEADAKDGFRSAMPRFNEPQLTHNLAIVRDFSEIAAELGCTPAQLAIAWLLTRGDHVVPIPGSGNIAHVEEDLAAADVKLDAATLERLEVLFPPNALSGSRYPASLQSSVTTELLPGEVVG
jgi:aryl-alcohol dehydrogenase-like predicted oxidoreductase